MFLPPILCSLFLSLAAAGNHSAQLFTRQELCNSADQPVKACGAADLTTANWASFKIDDFLSTFVQTFGAGTSTTLGFPGYFVQQNLLDGEQFLFDCSIIGSGAGSDLCKHPTGVKPNLGTDCAFKDIPNVGLSPCGNYITPQAGFVVENFIRFHQGVSNNFLAIEDAGNAILQSSFINDVVDGLSEEQGNILEAVFEAIAGFVLGILPFGRAFTLGVKLFKNLDRIYALAGDDKALSGPLDVIRTIEANEAIQDLAERTKDQLRRQVQEIVDSSQRRMSESVDIVFGTGPKSAAGQVGIDAQDNFAFNLAQSGGFLDAVPSREELAATMETNLKNWIVSSTMTGMDWNIVLDPTRLEDDPADVGGVCRKAMKGVPFILGTQCAEFRRGGFDSPKPENPAVLESLIDVSEAIRNAEECNGRSPNWQSVVDGTDDSTTSLPRCLYTFPVISIADRVSDGV
ncbi:uncharacterized protein Z520_06498 [Fonsecaea multimorphosa CBS 102226]|uniref:Uncharacterized protein n=1 Tax=Fonsecaea multimorphosa CBS 102226 TaxID=1442371 RepID=A0A0D2H788_9EURO|nr:uncharacterized protein Z520_06498 [Fonsecaea multimorphosa CBS 102226]KIX97720.1 hypothetical protein Z520_06498 [Fonsecaea multimorphosa CBS 102226]OAL23883.1 hypothetical protein AYO22_06059 [Fonsecaea multimorphosa]